MFQVEPLASGEPLSYLFLKKQKYLRLSFIIKLQPSFDISGQELAFFPLPVSNRCIIREPLFTLIRVLVSCELARFIYRGSSVTDVKGNL